MIQKRIDEAHEQGLALTEYNDTVRLSRRDRCLTKDPGSKPNIRRPVVAVE